MKKLLTLTPFASQYGLSQYIRRRDPCGYNKYIIFKAYFKEYFLKRFKLCALHALFHKRPIIVDALRCLPYCHQGDLSQNIVLHL